MPFDMVGWQEMSLARAREAAVKQTSRQSSRRWELVLQKRPQVRRMFLISAEYAACSNMFINSSSARSQIPIREGKWDSMLL